MNAPDSAIRRRFLRSLSGLASVAVLRPSRAAPESASVTFDQGLRVTITAPLEATFQVIRSYDENEKVLAVWSGERLQYYVTVSRLPSGWTDPKVYFNGLRRDLAAAASGPVKTGRSGYYTTRSTLRGNYAELTLRPRGASAPVTQVVHFLTEGTVTFVGMATLVHADATLDMLPQTVEIFRSAAMAAEPLASRRNESPYAGRWTAEAALADGRRMTSEWELKPDLSFASETRVDGRIILAGTGVWSVNGKQLRSSYLHSQPPLPENAREDHDQIVGFDGRTLVLQSERTGRKTTWIRKP